MKCNVCGVSFTRFDKVTIVHRNTLSGKGVLLYHADHSIGTETRLETSVRA